MRIIAAVIVFFAFAMPVHAQFEQLQFAICKKVIAESDRLKCYDAIGTKPHATSDEPIPVKGKWVYMESKSPTNDSDQVLAMLAGEPEDALLVFRCMEQRTEAVFVPPLGFFATGRANVLVRIDSATPDTITTSVWTNNRARFSSVRRLSSCDFSRTTENFFSGPRDIRASRPMACSTLLMSRSRAIRSRRRATGRRREAPRRRGNDQHRRSKSCLDLFIQTRNLDAGCHD